MGIVWTDNLEIFSHGIEEKIRKIFARKIDVPKELPACGGNADTVNGHSVNADVPKGAKFTDTTYPDAKESSHGLMSAEDKAKLNSVARGAEVNVQSDWNATDTGSDAYIKNKPAIPSRVSDLENDSGFACAESPVFSGVPKAPTPPAGTNNTQLATTAFVKMVVNALINGAPETLDTFGEIAEAFAENEAVIDALNEAIGKKLSKTEAAASAAKWTNGRNVDGLIIDGSSNRTSYGTCSTAAATAAKTVSCAGVGLVTGAEITVRFTVTNTAANPTLNVNGTGAKAVYYRGASIPASYLAANRTYIFRYNGTQWDLVGDLDTNTTYSNFVKSGAGAKAGLVPAPSTTAGTTKYLREDGIWQTPPDHNTTYADMAGATANAAGTHGLVPAPAAGTQGKYLRGDGTWQAPPNTTYGAMKGATATAAGTAGLVPAPAKGLINSFLRGDGTWSEMIEATDADIDAIVAGTFK